MRIHKRVVSVCVALPFILTACATTNNSNMSRQNSYQPMSLNVDYEDRLPQHISTSEKTVLVDPRVHAWGAYDSSGNLVRGGNASAGSNYCPDLGHQCHTKVGTFRVFSLGGPGCVSHIFPIPRGGAPMPYCMYFNNGQALHGVPDSEVGDGNFSHGCVRMHVGDAEWLRYNFVNIGTKVVIRPY